MDKFLKWIEENKEHRALTDKSYKKTYQKNYQKELSDCEVNTELATYGDAVLKLALCEILWTEGVKNLTEVKKEYESDEVLVKHIASHYDILKFLRFDEEDENIPKDYCYEKGENSKNIPKDYCNVDKKGKNSKNKHKYIATAIEACLGGMYMDDTVSWDDIIEIVKGWVEIIKEKSDKKGED